MKGFDHFEGNEFGFYSFKELEITFA